MFNIILICVIIMGAQCLPAEQVQQQNEQQPPAILQQIDPVEQQPVLVPENSGQALPLPQPSVEGGAPPPGDISESADAVPVDRSGTSDLDAQNTFGLGWGWGYRPHYRWGGYYGYPSYGWRRSGWGGRSYYGGWGWGGGWGGRYYW